MRKRLDVLLVEEGHFSSRTRAQEAIQAGKVFVQGRPLRKPSMKVNKSVLDVTIKDDSLSYVGRGGKKLEGALHSLSLNPRDMVVLDGGASTGGFTQCLLRHGAAKVYAVDVGKDQLAEELRRHPQVIVMDGINLRNFQPPESLEPLHLILLDLSFISVRKVLPALVPLLIPGGLMLILVKPQFEAGPKAVGKGGIVKDLYFHERAIEEVAVASASLNMGYEHLIPSPVLGRDGNQEYFLLLKQGGKGKLDKEMIQSVVSQAGTHNLMDSPEQG